MRRARPAGGRILRALSGAAPVDQDLTGFEDIEEGDEEANEDKVEPFGVGEKEGVAAQRASPLRSTMGSSSRSKVDALHAEVSCGLSRLTTAPC